MVVKSVRGRRRYIAVTVPPELRRDDLVASLSEFSESIPDLKVITCGNGKAVIRCEPAHVQAAISAVGSSYPGSESLLTSGTLRKLREAYPELKVPRKRKRHPRAASPYIFIGRGDRGLRKIKE